MKFLLTLMLILLSVALLYPQTLKVEPYGVSPGEVVADTLGDPNYLGIKDRRFSGLTNVGVETKVYLIGTFEDSILTASGWNMLSQPGGSDASLSEPTEVDESSEIITFIPDKVGKYEVEFYDGTTSDTVVISAGTYVGSVIDNCSFSVCHGSISTGWQGTGHATMLDRGLDGEVSSHYGESCVECHSVGYDPFAKNDGFDDFEFVFPDTLFVGMADSMYETYPEAMGRANIQCESCHGPFAGSHPISMSVSIEAGNCAYCHDDGSHHIFPSQWKISRHANLNRQYTRTSCGKCHNGKGFIEWVEAGKPNSLAEEVDANYNITCASCHDPHDATNPNQLRTVDVTLPNGDVITEGGKGKLCMNCHNSRRVLPDRINEDLADGDAPEPHHGPQAEVLSTLNVETFGEKLPTSPHMQASLPGGEANACVNCHMSDEGDLATAGMHTFSMVDSQGEDNVAACSPCHAPFGDEFGDKLFYLNGNADHDGDGTAEGLQHEVEGLLDTLYSVLPKDESNDIAVDSTTSYEVGAAIYNYYLVEEDRSMGIHNPAFIVSLLQLSIAKARGEATAIRPFDGKVPVSYALSQNYPNPFNPSTEIEFSIKKAGDVSLKVYDLLGREVRTLVDEDMAAGTYKVRFDGTNLASGVYIYRIVAGEFSAIKKMVLVK